MRLELEWDPAKACPTSKKLSVGFEEALTV
jgi:hypothetical protein